jgi:xylulokinase
MKVLALDVGSSSVIAGILEDAEISGETPRTFYRTNTHGSAVDVDESELLSAIVQTIGKLGEPAKGVDLIAMAVMAPAWVAMDKRGKALTPIVTHQDRRSVEEARELEKRIGKARFLRLSGNRPYPGGISATTWAWFGKHHPSILAKADLVGHLNTLLHRKITGARVIDPSNASFTGLYNTMTLGGWNKDLCAAVGARAGQLPEILDADEIAGHVTAGAAEAFGLTAGTPVLTGVTDGSAGMLRAGARVGQLFNVVGSTDVLALCTDKPRAREGVLTRALGVGPLWLQVCTLAAAASALYWARAQFFSEWSLEKFREEMFRLSTVGAVAAGGVEFEPYLAGDRTAVEQRQGVFKGLTLATTRENMLSAIIESLAAASAARLPLLCDGGTKPRKTVVVSGGAADRLDTLMHRDWPGRWGFKPITEATMLGLWELSQRAVQKRADAAG